jgi:hypothetical protein
MLVANCIAHETQGHIEVFDPINIYDIYLSNQDQIIVLSENDNSNVFISKFLQEFSSGIIAETKTKIIFLYKTIDIVKNQKIIYIPYDAFYHYNEYIHLNTKNDGYILCELNSISQKKNSIIENITYPINKDIPVRLVNCPRFDHPQNLGIVNDHDMLSLIANCHMFISLTDNYIYDAINLRKPTLSTVKNKIIEPVSSIDMNNIKTFSDITDEQVKELQKIKYPIL